MIEYISKNFKIFDYPLEVVKIVYSSNLKRSHQFFSILFFDSPLVFDTRIIVIFFSSQNYHQEKNVNILHRGMKALSK